VKASNAAVLRLLRARGADGLTSAEAMRAIACGRLAARIHELVTLHGFDIESVRERSEIGATYSRYYLREAPRFAPVNGTQTGMGL
jgi:Helix-turn-helix domain